MFDPQENYLEKKTIWLWWTGENELSSRRMESYQQFCEINKDCNIQLITREQIKDLPDLHEGYEYLSEIQKGDYLKAYFMHHHGGGYSDIKKTPASWAPYFDRIISNNNLMAIGYAEKAPGHVAFLEGCRLDPKESRYCRDFTLNEQGQWSSKQIKQNWFKLIGNGCFICRKNTSLTQDWWAGLTEKMDGYLEELKKYPSAWPRDSHDYTNPNTGEKSKYPIPWAVICGNIFHPLTLKYCESIDRDLPYPVMQGYQ
jgi:hypothetical protein